ncbi:MAG: hypothetical protein P4L91_06905 [Burkholderiaceae bacterium]|nr:hypothetical protein [Burkholderiaceae bacterium]
MTFTAYTFTDAQLVDIRRFCGYPVYGSGAVVFPAPWTMKQYMALEYKLQNINTDEANVVINTYLANLTTLETAIPAASANLDTDAAAVWTHNKNEQRDRERLFDGWRMRLCQFLGVPPGPNFSATSGALVV